MDGPLPIETWEEVPRPKTTRHDGAATPTHTHGSASMRAVTLRMTDVRPERVSWLWPARIPFGKLTILDGDPGLGKSMAALDIAARVSRGDAMPCGGRGDLNAPAGVVLLSAEDDPADTIRPRLDAAEADAARVVLLRAVALATEGRPSERMVTVADLDAIEAAARDTEARLVVVDPLMAYLPSERDSHRDQDVRGALAPLAELAARLRVAVLVIRHLNKSGGGKALYRGGGSIGIIGAARSGLLVAPDPDEPDGGRRILAVTKSNLAALPSALAYHIGLEGDVPRVVWEGTTEHTADALLAASLDGEQRGAQEEAKAFLREILAEGPIPAKEGQRQGKEAGISEMTLRRARTALGVRVRHVGGR